MLPRKQLHCNRKTVFSVRSVPRCYKQDKIVRSQSVGWWVSELQSIRGDKSPRKQMHAVSPSLLEWNHAACTVAGASKVTKWNVHEIYSQRYWAFGLCPSSGIFLNNNESESPISLWVIHHRQNPIVSMKYTVHTFIILNTLITDCI
jgi:hypothetical protein